MAKDDFVLEEYKSLRQEIVEKLRDRLSFSRWGFLSLAGLYSFILSHPERPLLYLVPVGLSIVEIVHLNEEHRMICKMGAYLCEDIESWAAGRGSPAGWQSFLASQRSESDPTLLQFWKRWKHVWNWSPTPVWLVTLGLTSLIGLIGTGFVRL